MMVKLPCERNNYSEIAFIMLKYYRHGVHIKIWDEFDVNLFDLSNLVIVQWWWWQNILNTITPLNLPASWCNFKGSKVLNINISTKFDVDLCMTFMNFQFGPKIYDLINRDNF